MENLKPTRPADPRKESEWSDDVSNEPSRRGELGGMESGESKKDQRSEEKVSTEKEIKYPSKPGSEL